MGPDFTVAGNPGPLSWIAQLSLTQTVRPFEQGLLSVATYWELLS